MAGKLFGNRIEPACGYCCLGTATADNRMILCPHSGVVEPFYSCRRFQYDPLRRIPTPPRTLPQYSSEEFQL